MGKAMKFDLRLPEHIVLLLSLFLLRYLWSRLGLFIWSMYYGQESLNSVVMIDGLKGNVILLTECEDVWFLSISSQM